MRRSGIILTLSVILLLLSAGNVSAQWENVSDGIGNRPVYSLYNNSSYIYAGSANHAIYLSSNNGTNWSPAGLNYFNITYAMTEFGGYLYAATELGVWRTSNNGAYWIVTSLNNTTMYSLASNTSRVFVGSHNSGLYYSSGGQGWFISSLTATSIKSLVINGEFIAAGCGNSAGVYISTNNGANWSQTALNNKSVYSMAMTGNNIFAGTGSGVYRSTDLGTTWVQTSLNNELVYSLAVSGSSVFAGTELHGVYVSENNGTTWVQKNEGLLDLTIHSLRIVNNFLFAGASANAVYRRPLGTLVNVLSQSGQIPEKSSLSQNYPNPFNPATKIAFSVTDHENVRLSIYNSAGQMVTVLVNDNFGPGNYEVKWDASGYSSGVYFCSIITSSFAETRRMLLVK